MKCPGQSHVDVTLWLKKTFSCYAFAAVFNDVLCRYPSSEGAQQFSIILPACLSILQLTFMDHTHVYKYIQCVLFSSLNSKRCFSDILKVFFVPYSDTSTELRDMCGSGLKNVPH